MNTRAPAVLKIECFADKKFCHREHIVCPGTQHLPLYTHKEHTFYVFGGRPHKGSPRIIQSLNMYFGLFIPHGRCDQSSPPSIFLRPSASQPGTKIYTNERRNDPPAIKFCCCYINTVVRRLPLYKVHQKRSYPTAPAGCFLWAAAFWSFLPQCRHLAALGMQLCRSPNTIMFHWFNGSRQKRWSK